MDNFKIDNYFSPVSRHAKRVRSSSSSPDIAMGNDDMKGEQQVGLVGVTHSQLMKDLNTLFDQKLSLLATKEDVLSVSTQVVALAAENEALKQEVIELKQVQKTISSKLVDLEARSRRNNLIFRGMDVTSQTRDYKHLIQKFCADKFGIGNNLWINRAHPLGQDKSAVIAHFPEDSAIEYIMSRAKNLKGTKYIVHRDFPQDVRVKRACLAAVRTEVERLAPGRRRMPIMFDHLTISGCRFTWEDGELRAGREDGGEKLRQLLGHDFSQFLAGVKQRGPGGRHTTTQQPIPRGTTASGSINTGNEGLETTTSPTNSLTEG